MCAVAWFSGSDPALKTGQKKVELRNSDAELGGKCGRVQHPEQHILGSMDLMALFWQSYDLRQHAGAHESAN